MGHDQTEALFDEINKLIKRNTLSKTILQLKLLNGGNKNDDIEIYENIIKNISELFGMPERELFENNGYETTNPKRTAYILINKYLHCSHESIALQFGKSRTTVTVSIGEFKKMEKDREFYEDYMELHDAIEQQVVTFIEQLRIQNR